MTIIFALLAISCGGDSMKDTANWMKTTSFQSKVPDESIVFAASDVEPSTIDHTVCGLKWRRTFGLPKTPLAIYSPIYLVIVGGHAIHNRFGRKYLDHLNESHPVSVEYLDVLM